MSRAIVPVPFIADCNTCSFAQTSMQHDIEEAARFSRRAKREE
jgi:hypothetical protein